MTREQLFDALRPIIMNVTGVPECILADPHAPSPDGVYASLEPMSSIKKLGQATVKRVAGAWGEVTTTPVTHLLTECVVNFYGGDARGMASELFEANKRPSVSASLREAGLNWHTADPVHNLTALQNDQREQRAAISIFIKYDKVPTPETSNSIESVSFNVQNSEGVEIADGSVEVENV